MKVDFNQIKTDISLPDFLSELGWKFVKGSSRACPKMSNGIHTIVIKRNAQNQYTYWDVHSDSVRGRTILDLMQEHLLETTGKQPTLREVGEMLQGYINTNQVVTPEKSSYRVGSSSVTTEELHFYLGQLKSYRGDYLQNRGITRESIDSPTFKDTFYVREVRKRYKTYQNICVKMYNEEGVQAISQRGETFKGIIGGKFDCLALSAHDRSRPIDILYVGESIVDCISHYQLHHEKTSKNLVYVSSEGTLTEGQLNLLQVILERNTIREIRTIFDNDKQGYKYTLWMYNRFFNGQENVENLSEETMNQKVSSLSFVDLPNRKDWNEDLMKESDNENI